MLEVASILSAFLCFALLHGAEPTRLPARLRDSVRTFDAWRLGARLAALLFFAVSVSLWGMGASGAVVWAGPLASLMVAGVAVVLLRPVYSRLIWGLAAACPPTIVVLAVLGGMYGG